MIEKKKEEKMIKDNANTEVIKAKLDLSYMQ